MYLFQEYSSPTVILAAAMVFLLTLTILPPSNEKEPNASFGGKLIRVISANTLPIYLFHVMILESIQLGYFGVAINHYSINQIIGVPLESVISLFVSLGIILLLKKVPVLKELIG